jgi:DNA-binding transcriptional ArsR family regulator
MPGASSIPEIIHLIVTVPTDSVRFPRHTLRFTGGGTVTEIRFSAAGLARVRVASGPSAEVELLHSLYMLNERPIRCFAPWRQFLRGRLDRRVRRVVDILTAHDKAETTPSQATLGRDLNGILDRYQEVAIAPFWTRIRTLIDADRSRRARVLLDGGVEQLLATLHPAIRWRTPVLRVAQADGRLATLSLDGDGLLLQPSVFVWRAPVLRRLGTGQHVLLYPVSCEISGGDPSRAPADLAALVGRARATMLCLLSVTGATTTELARRTNLSLAAVSQHAGVLRQAGLITTRPVGRTRFHSLTPLGTTLLGRSSIGRAAAALIPNAADSDDSGGDGGSYADA